MAPSPSNAHRPAAQRVASVLWVLFGFDGRIGREAFWLGFALVTLVEAVVLSPMRGNLEALLEAPNLPFMIVVLVALWSEFALAVKRLHDRGLSALFTIALLVPFANFVFFFIILGFMPGDAGANRFGPATNTRGR